MTGLRAPARRKYLMFKAKIMIESSKTCRVIPIAKAQQAPLFGSTVANGPAIVGDKVEIQLFTTLKCNISCSYCVMDVGDALGSQGKAS